MRLLVTRPHADGEALAALLRAQGHGVLVAPLLKVEFIADPVVPLDDTAALIFTSANGVRAFVAASRRRDLPCYAVGDRTASTLSEAGFGNVASAAGDVESLARLILAERQPGSGRLLHIAGSDVAGDLAGVLGEAGYRIERVVLYRTVAQDLEAAAEDALRERTVDGVLLFSPRTAHAFADQIRRSYLVGTLDTVTAWCLSAAVAHALGDLPFARIAVPETPTQDALLSLIAAAPLQGAAVEPKLTDTGMARPKDIEVTSTDSPQPPSPARRRRWPIYLGIVAIAVVSGATTARFWVPGFWQIEHGRLAAAESAPNGLPPGLGSPPTAPAPLAQPPAIAASERPLPLPPTPDSPMMAPSPDPRIDRLATDMATIQHKLAEIGGNTQPDHASLEAIIADQKSLAVSVAALQTRMTAIEKSLHDANAATATTNALLIAAEQLRQDLASSAPYAGPFAVLKTLGSNNPAIAALLAPLAQHAATGIESRAILARELDSLARTLAAPAPLSRDASWWQRLLDRVERLVVIRHVTDGERATAPDAVARSAAALLDQGDLDGAVARIGSISGSRATVVAPWLAVARGRLAAETASNSLVALLTARLTAPVPLGTTP